MDKLILVLYVDVETLEGREATDYVQSVAASLFPKDVVDKLEATTFVIPKRGGGTYIDSINPKFILDTDVYRTYQVKMNELTKHVDQFIKENKNNKNEQA
jgi:hypothetical protein